MPRRLKGLSHLRVAVQAASSTESSRWHSTPSCIRVKVLWNRHVKLTMCQRVNGWAEPAADRREQGGVLRLCLPFPFFWLHVPPFRTAPKSEQKHTRGPFTLSPLLLRKFLMEAFPYETLSCCRVGDCSAAWNEAGQQNDCGAEQGVNGNTRFLCLYPIRNGRYASNPPKRWIRFSRHMCVISHTSSGPLPGTGDCERHLQLWVTYSAQQTNRVTDSQRHLWRWQKYLEFSAPTTFIEKESYRSGL